MSKHSAVDVVHNFFAEVWQQPKNPDAIDYLVVEDFVVTTGDIEIRSRATFKNWVIGFHSKIDDLHLHIVESFQNESGDRVASRWRITGRNNGIMGTEPNGAVIDMSGTAIWAISKDGLLEHNWVERNAWEVYGQITNQDSAKNLFFTAEKELKS